MPQSLHPSDKRFCESCGRAGVWHFGKAVQNGIEAARMQLIAQTQGVMGDWPAH